MAAQSRTQDSNSLLNSGSEALALAASDAPQGEGEDVNTLEEPLRLDDSFPCNPAVQEL